jgi:hypothetical protein
MKAIALWFSGPVVCECPPSLRCSTKAPKTRVQGEAEEKIDAGWGQIRGRTKRAGSPENTPY